MARMQTSDMCAAALDRARTDASSLASRLSSAALRPPAYDGKTYYQDLTRTEYFDALITVRHHLKLASDVYFTERVGAKNVDLFMFTSSVSSPMGPGSDSEAVPIRFGGLETFLVDSSQFGFEPLLFRSIERVYCYLPSMRGEEPDARHLNQFYHCEAEIVGTLDALIPVVEGYVRHLAKTADALEPLISRMSMNPERTREALREVAKSAAFDTIDFDTAFEELRSSQQGSDLTTSSSYGRGMSALGEMALASRRGSVLPLWVRGYDRDVIAFYQKPDPAKPDRAINADLLFPPLAEGGFGGEIVGAGERQDLAEEMRSSLERQGIDPAPYEWYIDLRKLPGYRTTAGFGLGIERFLAWMLAYPTIRDVILYPRLKNSMTLP